jgi:hypothetical protein
MHELGFRASNTKLKSFSCIIDGFQYTNDLVGLLSNELGFNGVFEVIDDT